MGCCHRISQKDKTMTTIILTDANAFYCQAHAAFEPRLKGKAIVVLSSGDGNCISRTDEAKALGIKMGEPWFQVKKRFKPGVIFPYSSCFPLYADMSNRTLAIIQSFSPIAIPYSVDESWSVWTGLEHRGITDYAKDMKATILKWTGLPVCIGAGQTATQAKLANRIAKKMPVFEGVCNLNDMPQSQIDQLFATVPVSDVWGIGSRLSAKLNQIGIYTALDLKSAHPRTLRDKFNLTMQQTIDELRGIPCLDLERATQPKKNIATTKSFGQPVNTVDGLIEAVTAFTSRAAEKARSQNTHASSISVFIQTSIFNTSLYYGNAYTVALPSPTSDTRVLLRVALWILNRLYRPGYLYKKAGVLLSGLVPNNGIQRDLFNDCSNTDFNKRTQIMTALDNINQRYGRKTVILGSEGFSQEWQPKQLYLSPHYTTRWDDLIEAY